MWLLTILAFTCFHGYGDGMSMWDKVQRREKVRWRIVQVDDFAYLAIDSSYSCSRRLDLCIEIQNDHSLCTKLYDKTDDFNFLIVNFPFMYSNIPSAPAYGIYILSY